MTDFYTRSNCCGSPVREEIPDVLHAPTLIICTECGNETETKSSDDDRWSAERRDV